MRTPALGEAAANLPWLSPCAATLVALARATSSAVWSDLRFDPGLVLLLVRQPVSPGLALPLPPRLIDPKLLEAALGHLTAGDGQFINWNHATAAPLYRAAVAYARLAQALAERTGRADPDRAWIGGLLAPLGWMALHAATQTQTCRDVRLFPQGGDPLDSAAVARRLNSHWDLPTWLAAITGHLGLPVEVALDLGADADLFRIVQLAVVMNESQGLGLGLTIGAEPHQLARALGLAAGDLAETHAALPPHVLPALYAAGWESPFDAPLLPELLRLAADKRRFARDAQVEWLQRQLDVLHQTAVTQRVGEADRLQRHKLAALAELAAGAGHEINNPLAVISGQAQYLLNREEDPARRRALQTIIGQTQRIHQTLTGLMQFARPPLPKTEPVAIGPILLDVTATLQSAVEDKEIRLVSAEPATPLAVQADAAQLRTALVCLLRNAIEAAPRGGWASLRVEPEGAPDRLRFVVEDNGGGLSELDREHLFDPFYSGRKAGRGRGLGLSTAWRLAQQNGGDVHIEDVPGGPTRFVLSWPRSERIPLSTPSLALPEAEIPPVPSVEVNGCHAAVSDV